VTDASAAAAAAAAAGGWPWWRLAVPSVLTVAKLSAGKAQRRICDSKEDNSEMNKG
jgi:hypothetical protein